MCVVVDDRFCFVYANAGVVRIVDDHGADVVAVWLTLFLLLLMFRLQLVFMNVVLMILVLLLLLCCCVRW